MRVWHLPEDDSKTGYENDKVPYVPIYYLGPFPDYTAEAL